MRRKPLPSVEETVANARRIAILEDITNHTNVGAAFRSCCSVGGGCRFCARLHAAILCTVVRFVFLWARCSRCLGRALGSSPGEEWPQGGIAKLRSLGFKTAAMALDDNSVSLDCPELKECEKLAIIMGTEGDGLSRHTIAACDYTVKIPMAHGVDSLNVAAASAVAFWGLRAR